MNVLHTQVGLTWSFVFYLTPPAVSARLSSTGLREQLLSGHKSAYTSLNSSQTFLEGKERGKWGEAYSITLKEECYNIIVN